MLNRIITPHVGDTAGVRERARLFEALHRQSVMVTVYRWDGYTPGLLEDEEPPELVEAAYMRHDD